MKFSKYILAFASLTIFLPQTLIAGFYIQSIRRAPTPEEQRHTPGKFYSFDTKDGLGTGWWLKGPEGKYFIASAQHVFSYGDLDRKCSMGEILIVSHDGFTGRCKKVIAADKNGDFVIFEISFKGLFSESKPNIKPLRLASFMPDLGTRLKLIGHPSDPKHNKQQTITENCWVKAYQPTGSPWPDTNTFTFPKGSWVEHNCSAHTGNSGGPVIMEGTDIALGTINNGHLGIGEDVRIENGPGGPRNVRELVYMWRPFIWGETIAQDPKDSSKQVTYDYGEQEHFASWDLFIKNNRKKLEKEGIEIVDQKPYSVDSNLWSGFDYLSKLDKQNYNFENKVSGKCEIKILKVDRFWGLVDVEINSSFDSSKCKMEKQTMTLQCNRFPGQMCTDPYQKDDSLLITGFSEDRLRILDGRDRTKWEAELN
jgi:hypothetical protein